MHGAHVVAQKFSTTGVPRSAASEARPPSSRAKLVVGAA
jgi:hypothetical protein